MPAITAPGILVASGGECEPRVFVCTACGWEYSEEDGLPDVGYPPGTRMEHLPDDFTCPECGAGKEAFVET